MDRNELLQACVEETLRIYPPAAVGFTRVVPKPGPTIAGKFVPEGVSQSDCNIWNCTQQLLTSGHSLDYDLYTTICSQSFRNELFKTR